MSQQQAASGGALQRLQDLLAFAQEAMDVEIKRWLDLSTEEAKADLAQALLALANHGGGYIIVGYCESHGKCAPDEQRPSNLSLYNQDLVNGIIQSYADPAFHCQVHHVVDPQSGGLFPIIVVPGGHRVPIRARRDGPNQKHVRLNSYYIRRPGPKSEQPQTAQEWDQLIGRCVRANREDLVDQLRLLLLGLDSNRSAVNAEEQAKQRLESWITESRRRWQSLVDSRSTDGVSKRFRHGVWTAAYSVLGDFPRPPLQDLMAILQQARGHETGWVPWWVPTRNEIKPYPFDGLVECWLVDGSYPDPAHSDFWRASPEGMMYLLRGYQEDSRPQTTEPGTVFDLTLPIWRVGECLLHAEQFARLLGEPSAPVLFSFTFQGLAGRVLTSWASPERYLSIDRKARQGEVTSTLQIEANTISTVLPEAVLTIVRPLYEIFEFFSPSPDMLQQELARMRKGI